MREIKYRAWLKDKNKMVEVSIVRFNSKFIEYFEVDEDGILRFKTSLFEDIEFMQYTNIKDMNGKEIYEGDIIENNVIDFRSDVSFSKKSASFVMKNNLGTEFHLEKEMVKREFQIIGNIYENKDLIKKIRTRKEDVLKVEVTKINDKYSTWWITYQNEDVLKRGEFQDLNLLTSSNNVPNWGKNCLFLRGKECENDETPLLIPTLKVPLLIERVKQVNEKYGIEVLEIERAKRDE
ncbi:YopX family protein [Streptobacillus moniliformis]|uniref:YopX family protein n=1 Tax=Streptobacillus moniliformis TaxID=34105 RepID=UPI0007E37C0B|nr:YopX family protein [Streptobacillus moniliformis]